MSYKKAKKAAQSAGAELSEAQAELEAMKAKRETLLEKFGQSGEALQEARVSHKFDGGSKKAVTEAEKVNRDLKEQLEQLKSDIEVQQRGVTLLQDKHRQAVADMKQKAKRYHEQKLEPVYGQISDAIEQIYSGFEQIKEHRKEIQSDGLDASHFMRGLHHDPDIFFNRKRVNGMIGKDFISGTKFRDRHAKN
jgi:uncharacterized phage infection (PIP) family protein YhgE